MAAIDSETDSERQSLVTHPATHPSFGTLPCQLKRESGTLPSLHTGYTNTKPGGEVTQCDGRYLYNIHSTYNLTWLKELLEEQKMLCGLHHFHLHHLSLMSFFFTFSIYWAFTEVHPDVD